MAFSEFKNREVAIITTIILNVAMNTAGDLEVHLEGGAKVLLRGPPASCQSGGRRAKNAKGGTLGASSWGSFTYFPSIIELEAIRRNPALEDIVT